MNTNMNSLELQVKQLILFYENISIENLMEIKFFYAAQATFKDPFNEVSGIQKIIQLFEHMFQSLERPSFIVKEVVTQGEQTFLTWEFKYSLKQLPKKGQMVIHGASHIAWTFDGMDHWRVKLHRDYWDAAEEVYEKIPVFGLALRWLKKKIGAPL